MGKIGKKILDKDILHVAEVDGELTAHIDGYIYMGDFGLKFTQFTGVYIPLKELEGLDVDGRNELIDEMEEESTQYIEDLGEVDIDEFLSEAYKDVILPVTLEELPFANEGWYYLV